MPTRVVNEHGPVAAVLRLLASHGPASRTELAARLGVSAATLTRTVKALSQVGLVDEERGEIDGPGRPVRLVSLVPGGAVLMGVKLTSTDAWVVGVDPAGEVMLSLNEPLLGQHPDEVVSQLAQLYDVVGQRLGTAPAAIGISLGASVVEERVVRVATFLGWRDVPLARMLSDAVDVPVRVSNDVRALAYAEAWYGHGRGLNPFALLTVGAGIGCGIVVGGEVLSGAHGAAGSVGHLPVAPGGPRCEVGHEGCARALASTSGMLEQACARLGRTVDVDELAALDAAGDPDVGEVLEDAAGALGLIAGALTAIVDPALIVLSGEGAFLMERHEARLRAALDRARHWTAPAPRLRIVPFTFLDWARGAATVAVDPWSQLVQDHARAS